MITGLSIILITIVLSIFFTIVFTPSFLMDEYQDQGIKRKRRSIWKIPLFSLGISIFINLLIYISGGFFLQ